MLNTAAPSATRAQRALLVAGALGLCATILAAGEAFCRVFLDVSLQGNSRELFIGHAWGDSMGNARNAHGVSFGAPVWTDANGFRIDPALAESPAPRAVLLLGDSVAFGVGVPEAHTFAGLLRRSLTDTRVFNSSVIGYALPDYLEVVDHFLPAHPDVKTAVLTFCLNDVSHESASDIRAFLSENVDEPTSVIVALRAIPPIGRLNSFLRARSKLYLAIKNTLTDPGLRTFSNDRQYYDVPEERFRNMMAPLLGISERLRAAGVRFVVVIAPAEPQLRSHDPALDRPQQRLAAFFHAHDIDFVDPLPAFREAADRHRKLYLSGDAMHFSEDGHRLFFEAVRLALTSIEDGGRVAHPATPAAAHE